MKNLLSFSLLLSVILFNLTVQAQTDYTWDGSTDTDFATADNWTPSGVPGSGDNITIVTGSNTCQLDGNRTVNKVTVTSGTLDLETYTLTVSDRSTLNGGTMEDGKLLMTTGTAVFNGTTMDCKVDVTANITKVYDTHFKDTVLLDEVNTGNGYYTHGNIFEKYTEITNNSTGYIYVANTAPDTFRVNAVFNLEAAGFFIIGQGATTVHFVDDVVLNNHSGNTGRGFSIGGNASSVVDFLGDIEMNVTTGSGYIAFNLGTITHHGQLTVGSEGYHSGTLTLKGYRQNAAMAVDLSPLEDDARITLGPDLELEGDLTCPALYTKLESGCEFNGDVTIPDMRLWYDGSVFNGVTDITVTVGNVYSGGNMFNDTTNLTNEGTGYFGVGGGEADTFNMPVTFNLEAAGYLIVGNGAHANYYADKVTLNNHSGNSSRYIRMGGNASTDNVFDGEIEMNVDSVSGDISFWLGTTHNGLLTIGSEGYNNGTLTIRNYEQTASGTIDLSTMDSDVDIDVLTGADITADFLFGGGGTATLTDAVFQGDVTIESSSLPVTDCTFHGTTYLEKTGGVNNLNDGNAFHGPVTIENSSTSNYLYWGNAVADTFKMDLTLINRSSQPLWINYSSEGELGGDLTLDGDSASVIRIGSSTAGRKVVFNGSTDQHISILEADLDVQVYRMEVDKPSGRLLIDGTLDISHELELINGIIGLEESTMLILQDGVEPTATDTSYVEGPVKKIGDDAYTFPVGRNGVYRPIGISAPSSASDAFTAEYFESNSDWINSHNSKDGSLDHLSTNEYWTLTRDAGTSTPTVTLSWDTITSCVMDTSLAARHIAGWDGSNWDDLGNGGTTGDASNGTIITASAVSDFEMFVLESDSAMQCECELPPLTLGPADTCIGYISLDDNELWVSLVADSSSIVLEMWQGSDDDIAVIDSVMIYEQCGDTPFFTKGVQTRSDSTGHSIILDGLTASTTYKLRLKRKDTVLGSNWCSLCVAKNRGGGPNCSTTPVGCDLVMNGDLESFNNTAVNLAGQCVAFGVMPVGPAIASPLCSWQAAIGTPDIQSALCDNFTPAGPPTTPVSPPTLGWHGTQAGGIGAPTNGVGGGIVDNVPGNSTYVSLASYSYRSTSQWDLTNSTPNWREFISTTLVDSLEKDVCYYYAYDVATRSNSGWQSRWAACDLGIAFSNGSLPNLGMLLVPLPQNILELPPIGTVGSNWVTINSVIQPTVDGLETVTIGNFRSDAVMLGGAQQPPFTSPAIANTHQPERTFGRCHVDNIKVIKMAIDLDTNVFCGGDAVSLGCMDYNGFQYIWRFEGDTLPDTSGVLVIDPFLPEDTGTYILDIMAPDSTWCADTVTIHMADPEINLAISGCAYTCDYDSCTLSIDTTGYENIVWNVPDSIVWTDHVDHIVITDWANYYGEDVVIWVSAVDGEGKGLCNYIEIAGCCLSYDGQGVEWPRVVDIALTDMIGVTGAPTVGGLAPYTITEDFTITGTFTIDADLEIQGCEVVLDSNANIIVNSNVNLTITEGGGENSWLHACGDFMWKQLKVWENGSLTVESNTGFATPTTIEDAEFGTLFRGNGMLDVRNSEYKRNIFGIFVVNKTDMTTAILSNNDFTCPSLLNTNTFDRTVSLAGLFAENSSVASGTSEEWPGTVNDYLPGNYFAHGKWGIRGENSDVSLFEFNVFDTIRKADPYGGWRENGGWGVQCYAPAGSDRAFHASKNNTFRDSDCGIFTWGMNDVHVETGASFTRLDGGVDVNGNASEFDGYGILTHASTGDVEIIGGTFTDCEMGIVSRYNDLDNTERVLIGSNTITQTTPYNPYTFGIQVIGFGPMDDTNVEVGGWVIGGVNNQFIYNMALGVWAFNLQNPIIHHNDISTANGMGNGSTGILALNCPRAQIVNNEVIGGSSTGNYIGIQTQSSPFADIRCNDILNTQNAMYNFGGMPGALVENNTMDDSENGYVHKNGFLNNQGNDSIPSDNEWVEHDDFTRHTWNISGTSTSGVNRFSVRPVEDTDFYPDPFEADAANQPLNIEVIAATDTFAVSETDCDSVPQFRNPDPTLAKAIAMDTLVFVGTDSIEAREWARLHLYRSLRYDTIYTIDSTFQAFVDTMELTAYLDLDSVTSRLTFPLDSATEAQLLGITDKVTTTDTLQDIYREVLEIGVDHYYSGDSSWTAQHMVDLRTYAALCPFKYGPGVYHARALLLGMDSTMVLYVNDCELPTEPSGKWAGPENTREEENEHSGTLRLYPNPTTGIVTVECHLDEGDVAELMVFDMTGRRVYSNTRVCGSNSLKLDGLSEGLYQCILVINGKASLSEKLVILRE